MTFLVDENLENFRDTRLVGRFRFYRDHSEFQNLISASDRFPVSNESVSTVTVVKFGTTDITPTFSDGTLTVLSSKNNSK